jgi:hypothetical protein
MTPVARFFLFYFFHPSFFLQRETSHHPAKTHLPGSRRTAWSRVRTARSSLPDYVALKLHLMACDACPKFENQLLTLRAAMKQWRHGGGAESTAGDEPAGKPGK